MKVVSKGPLENDPKKNRGQDVIIEKATVSDAEELLGFQKLAYRSEGEIYNDFSIPPSVQTLESLEEDFENQFFLKAVVDEKIIGSVRAHSKEGTCYIGRLIVHPDFQHRGIGTKLMNEIERIFSGCRIFKTAKITDHTAIVFLEKNSETRG